MDQESSKLAVGDRVRVAIADPSIWATHATEALNGHLGRVEEVRSVEGDRVLVAFADPKPPTWWKGQSPIRAWWFELSDLERVE